MKSVFRSASRLGVACLVGVMAVPMVSLAAPTPDYAPGEIRSIFHCQLLSKRSSDIQQSPLRSQTTFSDILLPRTISITRVGACGVPTVTTRFSVDLLGRLMCTAQIRSAVLSDVLPTASMAGITVTGGRLNLLGLFGGSPPPPVDPIHDVAGTSISAPGTAKLGRNVSVSISVANQGNQPETFSVSLASTGGTPGAPQTITLNPRSSATVAISWRAPSVRGTYALTGSAAVVSGETDTADNSRSTTVLAR